MLRVLGNVAVNEPLVPAVLYGAQKPIGAIAVTALQQVGMAMLLCIYLEFLQNCMESKNP